MSKVVEVGTCIVCERNRKKTALIRAVSRHWRVVSNENENFRKGHIFRKTKIQGEKV